MKFFEFNHAVEVITRMYFNANLLSSLFSIFILLMCQCFLAVMYDFCIDNNYLRLRKVT